MINQIKSDYFDIKSINKKVRDIKKKKRLRIRKNEKSHKLIKSKG